MLQPTSAKPAAPALRDAQQPSDMKAAPGPLRSPRASELHVFYPALDALSDATLAGCVAALLYRYTGQTEARIALEGGSEPCIAELTLDQGTTFGELAAQADPSHTKKLIDAERPQVALSVLRDAGAPTPELATAHTLHFVLRLTEKSASYQVLWDGATFDSDTVEAFAFSLSLLINAASTEPSLRVERARLMSLDEARRVVAATESAPLSPPDEPFHTRFERLAQRKPEALALRCGEAALSYAQLDVQAMRLAAYLHENGVRSGKVVGVCLSPRPEVLVAILAIFKAGGVYLPLDPHYPRAHIEGILNEAAPVMVLTDEGAAAALPETTVSFCFGRDDALLAGVPVLPAHAGASIHDDAYIVYTSGSTGKPKGVVASQKNLAHYLRAARERFDFGPNDRFCALARYSFSISFFELLSPLAAGGSVYLARRDEVLDPERLLTLLSDSTVAHLGPSLLFSLVRHLDQTPSDPGRFAGLRHLSSGGDVVPPELLERLKVAFPHSELFVLYGCTEVSCMGTFFAVDRARTVSRCMVGRPFAGVSLRVLDAERSPVPFGVVGEVYFAGFGVARRYLGRPELTSERFVAIDGQRFYRTGDLGRLGLDGQLEFLGRSDFQVQVRGMRVELTGIEQQIRALGLAPQCAVVASSEGHETKLTAFLVDAPEPSLTALRTALAQVVPDYMLPQNVVSLAALPLSPNGKLDRRALVALASAAPRGAEAVSGPGAGLKTPLEREIAQVFAQILNVPKVDAASDFFALGGHSLLAVSLMEALQNRLGWSLSPSLVFEHPSVRALARAAETRADDAERPILLSRDDQKPALFALLGVHLYRELARALEGVYSVYGVFAGQELTMFDAARKEGLSVIELARAYVNIVRRHQPRGPYRLVGMSFGGVVAYEVAQQLRSVGEEVELLGLLDSVLPETRLAKLERLASYGPRALLSQLGLRLSRASRGAAHGGSPFVRPSGDAAIDLLEAERQRAYAQAAGDYLRFVRPYTGQALLVIAEKRLAHSPLSDPTCGFGPFVRDLQKLSVDSDHLGLLERPHVARTARALSEKLSKILQSPEKQHEKDQPERSSLPPADRFAAVLRA